MGGADGEEGKRMVGGGREALLLQHMHCRRLGAHNENGANSADVRTAALLHAWPARYRGGRVSRGARQRARGP